MMSINKNVINFYSLSKIKIALKCIKQYLTETLGEMYPNVITYLFSTLLSKMEILKFLNNN